MTETLLLSPSQVGKRLGLGRDATADLIRSGRIRSIIVGQRRLIPRLELEAWIERELNGRETL